VRSVHQLIWLGTASKPRAATFAGLFMLAAACRAVLITVVPLEGFALLGDAQRLSLFYFGISLIGLTGSLGVPWLVYKIRRRAVLSLGACCLGVGALLIAGHSLPSLIVGLAIHVIGMTAVDISLNLYLMDHIPRKELGRFEPLRLFFQAGPWALGPWLGVYLQSELAPWAPFAVSASAAVLLLTMFWYLRLTENPAVAPAKGPPPNPLKNLPHFFTQPRLRLAWLLAFGRAGWWAMFFVYAPIYAVTSGLSEEASGVLISVGMSTLFAVPLWGWVGRRYGLQRLLVVGYGASGLVTLAIALVVGAPWQVASILVAAALVTGIIDGAGNVPFLRTVHPLERSEMTAVFATYRDASQLAPPGVFALLLKVFELPAVFLAGGLGMLVIAHFARFLPRRF